MTENTTQGGLSPTFFAERPVPIQRQRRGGGGYVLRDQALERAAQTALILGQPLVLAGEPGVGKTEFARELARRIDLKMHPVINVSTTSEGRSLIYMFDEVKRFRDEIKAPLARYVRFTSFGRAILWAAGPEARIRLDASLDWEDVARVEPDALGRVRLGDLFPAEFRAPGDANDVPKPIGAPRASVVLLDEFDKAPRDAPNDLLGAVETMSFLIEELGIHIEAHHDAWPVLILTSNSEQSLPDAFLRRCVFHWIDFPEKHSGLLEEILALHCKRDRESRARQAPEPPPDVELTQDEWKQSAFVESVLDLLYRLRGEVVNKKPATAELLGFASALLELGVRATDTVGLDDPRARSAIGALLKSREDLRQLDMGR
jgi:MoxR-like ATPase